MSSGIDIQETKNSRQPQQEHPGRKTKERVKREDKTGNGLSSLGKQRRIKGEFQFPGKELGSHHSTSI